MLLSPVCQTHSGLISGEFLHQTSFLTWPNLGFSEPDGTKAEVFWRQQEKKFSTPFSFSLCPTEYYNLGIKCKKNYKKKND